MADNSKDAGKGSAGGAIIAIVIATLVAAGGGAYLGMSQFAVPPKAAGKNGEPHEAKPEGRYSEEARVRPLAPLTTNLAGKPSPWIRLEASVLVKNEVTEEEANKLTATISEDVIAFLRTTPVTQIQGASGYQSLREDLDERVRIRSEGRVKELIIQSLILE